MFFFCSGGRQVVLEAGMFFLHKLLKKGRVPFDEDRLPAHIAIIMDGNGRWAKKRGMTRSIGHREGSNTLRKIVGFCNKLGIKYLTVYAFSTENWKRPKNEVDYLMSLLLEYLRNAEKELAGQDIRIRVIGNTEGLPDEICRQIIRVMKVTEGNGGMILNIALNYGGRDEIINAVKRLARDVKSGRVCPDDIDECMLESMLYTSGVPDPDILIRTSGEKRISNFLLWQCAYTEFWYTDDLWPDFKEEHILEAIRDFQGRKRRYGGV
jgi:undecaprenyl diphosphate synthase